jgi:hypothetical protein
MIDSAADTFSSLAHDTKDKAHDKLDLVVDAVDTVVEKIKDADLPAPVSSMAAALPQRKRTASHKLLWIALAAFGVAALIVVMQKKGRTERSMEREAVPDTFGDAVTATRESTGAFA